MGGILLFRHQQEAIDSWIKAGGRGILSMATGTGKTYTALGALKHIVEKEEKLMVVISVPYAHLIPQWERSFMQMGIPIYTVIQAYSGNSSWKREFQVAVRQIANGSLRRALVLTTHDSLRSDIFFDVRLLTNASTMIIGDEVHGLGSIARKAALGRIYFDYRLGLSATPWRLWDDEGNDFLRRYFGKIVYEFSLDKAVSEINPITGKTYLTPYKYYPYFVFLNEAEMSRYVKLTMPIISQMGRVRDIGELMNDERFSMLLFKRAELIKKADAKKDALREILEDVTRREINTHILVYVEGKTQLAMACDLIKRFNISCYPFTMELSSKKERRLGGKSERDLIIAKFARGDIGALVSMKILDEGVDVPQAKVGVLVASTTSSRQYIQRLGRILRRSEGKEVAYIYDIVVFPQVSLMGGIHRVVEEGILRREFKRYMYIAQSSLNRFEVERHIYKYMDRMGVVSGAGDRNKNPE